MCKNIWKFYQSCFLDGPEGFHSNRVMAKRVWQKIFNREDLYDGYGTSNDSKT